MSDYTLEMFRQDHDQMACIVTGLKLKGKLHENDPELTPDDVIEQIYAYFINKYAKNKGQDYAIRFLTVTEFIDHYQKDLARLGVIIRMDEVNASVQDRLFELLLDSFRTHSPGMVPSSTLLNRERKFNYKKVIKALGL
jgi:hypothetical protein